MSDVAPVAGVSVEQYARLCVAMADTAGDESRELAIAAEAGVGADAWRQAKAEFTRRMQDPADMGRTAQVFMKHYQAAQAAARGGAEPCTLELFTVISAEYSFLKDAAGNKVPFEQVFASHGITGVQWNEYTSYWTPKVNDPADPDASRFRVLMQAESDRIFGIKRDAGGSVVHESEDSDATEDTAPQGPAPQGSAPRPAGASAGAASGGEDFFTSLVNMVKSIFK